MRQSEGRFADQSGYGDFNRLLTRPFPKRTVTAAQTAPAQTACDSVTRTKLSFAIEGTPAYAGLCSILRWERLSKLPAIVLPLADKHAFVPVKLRDSPVVTVAFSSQSAISEIKLLTTQIPGWTLSSLRTRRKPANFRLRARLDVCLRLPAKRQVEQSSAPHFTDLAIPFDCMSI